MGCVTNEADITGARGIQNTFPEIDAQLNAIDMGWPMDELVNIARLRIFLRDGIGLKSGKYLSEEKATMQKARDFYNERIKDKPYPATEEERKNFYRDFLNIGMELKQISTQEIQDENGDTFVLEWTEFTDKPKECMDKPLTFAERLALDHFKMKDEDLTINAESVRELKDGIGKDRFGHINSTEYKELKSAFGKLEAAFASDENGFVVTDQKDISSDNLKILEGLKASAEKYLKGKDTEKKLPKERSEMGKARYESAQKAHHLADKLLKQQEAKLEKEANAKKQAEREKGRKEMKEAFFDANSVEGKKSIKFDRLRAGGDEAYSKLKEEEARKEAEAAKKEPVTDKEKYDKFINECRLKKDAPVSYEDEGLNKEMQQKRVDNLGNMLAAMEYKASGKPFNEAEIFSRGVELKDVYSLNALKYKNKKVNGPEKLKNALTFGFRAEALKSEFEQAMYEIGKKKYKNTNEAQSKYQKDITELLERKQPEHLSEKSQKIIYALTEIKNINTGDKNLAAMNAYKMGKANKQLMEVIGESFADEKKMDMDAYGPKLALDSLAVLSTYTNCNEATNMLLQKVNAKIRNKDGSKLNINTADFNRNYGVKHSKELAQTMSPRPNAPANNSVNPQMAAQGNQPNAQRKNVLNP